MNIQNSKTLLNLPSDQDASGRQLGDEEIKLVTEALRSGTLTSTKGQFVKSFEKAFADLLGCDHAFACGSGTGAIHAAIAAVDPEPGDEIITSPITDMGAITPIIYQTAVPVFADVDPISGNVTAEAIERVIGPKTRAIVVTHLFGNPADMGPIMALSEKHGIPVIEDCAQAYGTTYGGKPVGTIGAIGCFSLQQGKHITTGEGGIVVANDPHLARRMRLFIDKAWGYGDPKPDHYFVALNGRMTELQGAVALAQLGKLDYSIKRRADLGTVLTDSIKGLNGVTVIPTTKSGEQTYWKYALHVDADHEGPDGMAKNLRDANIPAAPRYIQKPAFECSVIRDQKTFGNSSFPFNLARAEVLDYSRDNYQGTYDFLSTVLVLGWNEKLCESHVEQIAAHIAAHVGT